MTIEGAFDGAALMRDFVPASPFVALLGIELVDIRDGWAELRMPYREDLATMGTTTHGGAVAALADTAAMAAAWAGARQPERLQGSTAALTVNYLAPASGAELRALATVLRRGKRLVHVEVDVTVDAVLVAKATAVYSLG